MFGQLNQDGRDDSMNREDILALARAGFTKEQIAIFLQQEDDSTHAAAPQQGPGYITINDPMGVQRPQIPAVSSVTQHVSTAYPTQDDWSGLMEELRGLRQAVVTNNIQQSAQPQQAQTSVDDILATIINPPGAENGGTK